MKLSYKDYCYSIFKHNFIRSDINLVLFFYHLQMGTHLQRKIHDAMTMLKKQKKKTLKKINMEFLLFFLSFFFFFFFFAFSFDSVIFWSGFCFFPLQAFRALHLYFFFFFFFFWLRHGMRKFVGQGLNSCHSSPLSHCSDNVRCLTRYITRELTWGFFNIEVCFNAENLTSPPSLETLQVQDPGLSLVLQIFVRYQSANVPSRVRSPRLVLLLA